MAYILTGSIETKTITKMYTYMKTFKHTDMMLFLFIIHYVYCSMFFYICTSTTHLANSFYPAIDMVSMLYVFKYFISIISTLLIRYLKSSVWESLIQINFFFQFILVFSFRKLFIRSSPYLLLTLCFPSSEVG